MSIKNMNIKNMAQRTLGLILLLVLLAVDGVALKIAPAEVGAMSAVALTLLAVACVVAGYFLRTFWALLIVPLVSLGGAYLFGVLAIFKEPTFYFVDAILLVILSTVIALLALLGVLLGKRSARIVTMNIKNLVQRTLGLLLLLILLAVGNEVGTFVPTEPGAVYAVMALTLLAVACVVAGYFLRTFLALLIVPLVYFAGNYLFGVSPIPKEHKLYLLTAIFLIILSIPIALLALLGVLLGKRSERKQLARNGATLAAS